MNSVLVNLHKILCIISISEEQHQQQQQQRQQVYAQFET